MNILGIGGLIHNASAALVVDGQLAAAVEEERFHRIKHIGFFGYAGAYSGLPWKSIEYCLKEAGLKWKDIDEVGYFFNPWMQYRFNMKSAISKAPTGLKETIYRILADTNELKEHLKPKVDELQSPAGKIPLSSALLNTCRKFIFCFTL